MALRKADWLFKGTVVDPREVQLLFVRQDNPYTFTHAVDGRRLVTTITPRYRFIWQVRGVVDTVSDSSLAVVALMDYETGRVLYDVRDDLTPSELVPQPDTRGEPAPDAPAVLRPSSHRRRLLRLALVQGGRVHHHRGDRRAHRGRPARAPRPRHGRDARRDAGPSERTRFVMIRRLVWISILFVGGGIALPHDPGIGSLARAMLASAAIIAGVIGIAARAPIANLVSGIMIAFSQPVRLGDYISIDDDYGTVEQISLIYTYIRTVDDRRVVIPNEAFAIKAVHNYSMGSPGSMVAVNLAVPLERRRRARRRGDGRGRRVAGARARQATR